MLSTSQTPFATRNWQAQIDRFENARNDFDFESLEFSGKFDDNCASTVITSTFGQTFSSKLEIEPSEQFVKRSVEKLHSTRRPSKRSALDRLATQDVGFLGREQEVEELYSCYNDPTTKMVTIVGYSGSGKSALAQQIAPQAKKSGFVTAGKFDITNRADPYLAFTEAINELIRQISIEDERIQAKYRDRVQALVGDDFDLLIELVPLAQVFQEEGQTEQSQEASNTKDGSKVPPAQPATVHKAGHEAITERAFRLRRVVADFLRAVSSQKHITIILDDIQWGGPAALALLDSLLSHENMPNVFFVSTCRSEYFEEGIHDTESQSFQDSKDKSLEDLLERNSEYIHQMNLTGFSVDSIQTVINALLRIDSDSGKERTRELAAIVEHKTNGNPFFVLAFMQALVDEDLVNYNHNKSAWEWFEMDIQSRNVAENVAEAVTKRLERLPPETLFVVQVAACISRSFEQATIQFVLSGLPAYLNDEWKNIQITDDLDESMAILLENGIFETEFGDANYSFAHDQIQQAAYRSIPADFCKSLQIAIGKRLIEGLDRFRMDQFLFTAVDLCGRALGDMGEDEKQKFAFWAFLAGDHALKQGAFDSALKFFRQGISGLGDNAFETDPELALPLYSGAAEAAYCAKRVEEVGQFAKCVKDQKNIPPVKKMRVANIEIKVHEGKRELNEAFEYFQSTVKMLGAGSFPRNPGALTTLYYLIKARKTLKKYDRQKLLALPECTNEAIKAAAGAFAAIIPVLYFLNPSWFVIGACKAVQWSIQYGVCKYTPDAWTAFSIVLIAAGDNDKALDLAESAMALCESHHYKDALPNTFNLVYCFIRHWKKPMHHFESPCRYGIDLAMRFGQLDLASNLMCNYSITAWMTSVKTLPQFLPDIKSFLITCQSNNHNDMAAFILCTLQLAQKLADPSYTEPTTLTGETMNEKDLLEQAKGDVVLTGYTHFCRLQLLVYFGDPEEACKVGKLAKDLGVTFAQSCSSTLKCTFMYGLAEVLAYKTTKRQHHLRNAKAMRKRLSNWLFKGNPNAFHLYKFLTAEIAGVKKEKKLGEAAACFREAISSASRLGYKLDLAHANERFSLYYCEVEGNMQSARQYMEDAIKAYVKYGAMNRVRYLLERYPDLTSNIRPESFENMSADLSSLMSGELSTEPSAEFMLPVKQ